MTPWYDRLIGPDIVSKGVGVERFPTQSYTITMPLEI